MTQEEKFYKQLKSGEISEKIISNYLTRIYFKDYKEIKRNRTSNWDFMIITPSKEVTFELKTDCWDYFKEETRGNIFIETWNRYKGMKSGVMASAADIFMTYLPYYEELYLIKRLDLIELMRNQPELFEEKFGVGDGGRVNGRTINKEVAKKYFKTISIRRDKKIFKDKETLTQEEIWVYKNIK